MRIIFLLLFLTSSYLVACNKSSNRTAYKDYSKYKQIYINSILENDKSKKISSLKEIISCGEFLGFNVVTYKERLKQLKKRANRNTFLRIVSYKPFKIKLTKHSRVNYFTLKGGYYKRVFDISNATIKSSFFRKIDNISIKMATYKKNVVRVVFYSKHKFRLLYSKKGGYLTISYYPPKIEKKSNIIHKKIYSKKNRHKNKRKYKIVIDAGHGGKDSGGVGYKHIKEKGIVLNVGNYLYWELKKRGYQVYRTRRKDKFIKLKERTRLANRKKADLFISLHCNISPTSLKNRGVETYFLSPARTKRAERVARLENREIGRLHSTTQKIVLDFMNKKKIIQSNKLAIDIQRNILYNLRKRYREVIDGAVREAPFWVLVGTQMPAILIEMGYLSNKKEALRLKTKKYQKFIVQGIANGVDAYFRKN